jgi:hypothetical protein
MLRILASAPTWEIWKKQNTDLDDLIILQLGYQS